MRLRREAVSMEPTIFMVRIDGVSVEHHAINHVTQMLADRTPRIPWVYIPLHPVCASRIGCMRFIVVLLHFLRYDVLNIRTEKT